MFPDKDVHCIVSKDLRQSNLQFLQKNFFYGSSIYEQTVHMYCAVSKVNLRFYISSSLFISWRHLHTKVFNIVIPFRGTNKLLLKVSVCRYYLLNLKNQVSWIAPIRFIALFLLYNMSNESAVCNPYSSNTCL